MTVMEIMKKSLAFGLGAAAFSAEKIKQLADEMVARGEMSSEEARKFVDEVSKRADDEKGRIQEWLREQMSRMLQQAGAAESARVDALERRVAELEKKLATAVPEHEATSDLCEPEGCG